jgi:hypothetical protein
MHSRIDKSRLGALRFFSTRRCFSRGQGMKAFFGVTVCLLVIGCGPQGSAPQRETGQSSSRSVVVSEPARRNDRDEKVRFLNSIREADPQYQTIQRAVMNDRDELGIVLSRNVAMDDIPKLMQSLLKRMASEFPGQDLTVVAYALSDPPMKIGRARLDASTREMTYTAARR